MLLYSLLAQSHNAIRFGSSLRKNNTIFLLLDSEPLPKESAIKAERIPPRRVPSDNSSETNEVGITITDHLQWFRHIKQISLQANRTLDLIHRICRDISNTEIRKLLYCSIVRLKLEYAKLLLNNVQRRAKKFILSYVKDMPHKDCLHILNILPLEYRRELKDLQSWTK